MTAWDISESHNWGRDDRVTIVGCEARLGDGDCSGLGAIRELSSCDVGTTGSRCERMEELVAGAVVMSLELRAWKRQ